MCRLFAAVSVAALAVLSTQASAQSSDTDAILERLEAKVDALAKENAELRERVRRLEPSRQSAKTRRPQPEVVPQTALAAPQEIVPPTILNVSASPALPEAKHTSGIVGGVEGMLIKPYYTGAGAPNVDALASFFGSLSTAQVPYSYRGGLNAWLGYVDASGWGGRLRFFDYGNKGSNDVSAVLGAPPGVYTLNGSMALTAYDVELTKQLLYGDWNLTGFAGVRFAEAKQTSNLQSLGGTLIDSNLGYKGTGPTAGLEGEVVLIPGGPWSIFYSGRGSLLFGGQTDVTTDVTGVFLSGTRDENAFASIWEFNAGPQWKTPVAGVGDVFVRVTADAQYWQGVSNFTPVTTPFGLVHNDYSGGFGLWGFTAAMGIER